MPTKKRKIQYVGERIQRVLAARAAMHWVFCLAVVFASVFVSRFLSEPKLGMLQNCFLPWVIIDNMRLSNRFSGPLSRIQSSLQRMRAGKRMLPIRIRKRDFFHDMVAEINSLAASIDRLEIPGEAPTKPIGMRRATVADQRRRELAKS
jgi:hypothetical protein